MKAAVLHSMGAARPYRSSEPLTILELDTPKPGPHEVLIKMEAAGVCHSDLSVVNGSLPKQMPLALGHEGAGVVVEIGPEVSTLSLGQRVVLTFMPRCGQCPACATDGRIPCHMGAVTNRAGTLLSGAVRLRHDSEPVYHHVGVSAFAEYAVVDHRAVVPVDDDVPPDVAALLGCAVLTGGGALLNSAKPEPDDSVMIVGLGGVGLASVITAAALGCRDIIAVDVQLTKLEAARSLGATRTYTPDEVIDGHVTANIVIEAAGSARALETALTGAGLGAQIVTVGLPDPEARASLAHAHLVMNGQRLIGSYLGSSVPQRDIPLYVSLWREGKLPIEKLVSRRIALHEINGAMDDLADGEEVRQVIDFDR